MNRIDPEPRRDDSTHDDYPWSFDTAGGPGSERRIRRGTNRLDMIRTALEDELEGRGLTGRVAFTVEDAGSPYMRLTFDYSKVGRRGKAAGEFSLDVGGAIEGSGHWTCRERNQDESADTEWYVARYNGGSIF